MWRLMLGLMLSFMLPGPAISGQLEEGIAASRGADYTTALRLLRPLADQGDPIAQSQLGVLYAEGRGLPQNYEEAIKWYRKAADQGEAGAQFNLGLSYQYGKGVPQDYVQAHKWANLATARSLASQPELHANAVKLRDFIAEKMTAAQIAEAQRLASEWRAK